MRYFSHRPRPHSDALLNAIASIKTLAMVDKIISQGGLALFGGTPTDPHWPRPQFSHPRYFCEALLLLVVMVVT